MNLSYWEYKTWLTQVDYTIVGSGIVGLNCAFYLKERFPKAKILILERGILPQGASTKNAGFACFGSVSEILSDLKTSPEEEVVQLVQARWDGIQQLRKNLGDSNIGFENLGGHEIFLAGQTELFDLCQSKLKWLNQLLHPIFNGKAFELRPNKFHFKNVRGQYITNPFEAQIDTGKMMSALLDKVRNSGVRIINSVSVEGFAEIDGGACIKTNQFEFISKKLLFATNGFAPQLLNEEVRPARAQVLITKPVKDLHIKGTFHFDEGYYYFRNIDNRILLGGGRNIDFMGEETAEFGKTVPIQNKLEELLSEVILPNTSLQIDQRWSGIMGVGDKKRPIVKQISNHVFCGVRLGGMGIAIGSAVGKELAELVS